MRARAGTALSAVCTALLLAVVALSGCAPQSPDHSSWTDQAHQALDDVASEVATVMLLLELEADGKVPGKFQQVVAQDSETAVGETMSKFGGEQPEPRDDDAYARVTGLMSDASSLFSEVRIAIVRRDDDAYPGLLRRLEKVHGDLVDAARSLRTPAVGSAPLGLPSSERGAW